jgi:hypothetical protein
MTLDTTADFDTILAFVTPLDALLLSIPMMWHEEHF